MASSVEEGMANSHENGIKNNEDDDSLSELNLLKEECQKWKSKSQQLQTELDETKSEVAVANCVKESMIELDRQKRSLDSEMATMQQLLTESHDEANSQKTWYEHEIARLKAVLEQMEVENREMKIQMKLSERNAEGATNPISVDKDTLLGGAAALKDVTSNFARKVKSNLNSVIPQQGSNNSAGPALTPGQDKPSSPSGALEPDGVRSFRIISVQEFWEDMQKRLNRSTGGWRKQQEAEKDNEDYQTYTSSEGSKLSPTDVSVNTSAAKSTSEEVEVGMRKAYEDTELLKSIVLPLEEQIQALKDKLRQTDYHLSESENRQTKIVLGVEALAKWLEGKTYNDAVMHLDSRRKELLSFSELKQREEVEEEKSRNYKDTERDLPRENEQNLLKSENSETTIYISLLQTRIALLQKELYATKNELSNHMVLSDKARKSNTELRNQVYHANSKVLRLQKNHLSDLSRITSVLSEDQKCQVSLLKRNEDKNNASNEITDKESAEDEDIDVKYNQEGTMIIMENDWLNMKSEIKSVRALLGVGVEDNLIGGEKFRELQFRLDEIRQECDLHAKNEEKLKDELAKESEFRQKVETEWNERADLHKSEVELLTSQLKNAEAIFEQLRFNYGKMYQSTQKDLKTLTTDREKIVRELRRLQDENDSLVGKYSAKAEEMQNEIINLPEKLEDIHLLLLRYREDLITTKLAKERLEEKLKSEVSFLKAQVAGEQQAKEDIEDQLTTEIEQLKEKVYLLESCKSELEAEQKRGKEYEENQLRHRETNANLQSQMNTQTVEKQELEAKIAEMNAKIKNLQQELDNSVAVQNDFVRLSQSLQMELEKIRQGEKELRWQHEDDVRDCQGCRKSFAHSTSGKRKHHCRHCGRIFCVDCLMKTVPSGPQRRPTRVCDVCHTLLVQNSAPYFSTEPPQLAD